MRRMQRHTQSCAGCVDSAWERSDLGGVRCAVAGTRGGGTAKQRETRQLFSGREQARAVRSLRVTVLY